eukprot:Skav218073  [mRNA]  locus=scaffold1832:151310:152237:- [translate_table: standard]
MKQAYASFWPKDPPARVAVQVAALAGNASVPSLPDPSAKGVPDLIRSGISLINYINFNERC